MKRFLTLILISTAILLPKLNGYAQYVPGPANYEELALLFGHTSFGGSARIQGLGGASISLGGDISNISSNPAGLGFFNRSEFSFSPTLNFINTDSRYLGVNSSDSRSRFNFSNIGVVLNSTKDDVVPGKWRGGSFGISVNKINDFNSSYYYEGFNENSTILDYFYQRMYGVPVNDFEGGGDLFSLAYFSYLMNPDFTYFDNGFDDVYYPIVTDSVAENTDYFLAGFPTQSETINTTGGQYQWSFSYGGNYDDKLYFGASLGIVSLTYQAEKIFGETFSVDLDEPLNLNFNIIEEASIRGTGINGTFGVIMRPNDMLRVGASVTTPTFYNIDDDRIPTIAYDFNNYYYAPDTVVLEDGVEEGFSFESRYSIRTPLKLNGGISFFFDKNGFITADVEYLDYSSMHMSSNDFEMSPENRLVEDLYRNVINYRVGAEYRFDIFRFRGGYAHQGDPYQNSVVNRSVNSFSLGFGVRTPKFYADLAVVTRSFESAYSPYGLNPESFPNVDGPTASFDNSVTNAVLSAGFFF